MVLKEHMLLKSLTVSVSAEWSLVYCYMIYCVQDEIFTLWTIFITKWQGCDIDLTVIPIGSKAVAKHTEVGRDDRIAIMEDQYLSAQ